MLLRFQTGALSFQLARFEELTELIAEFGQSRVIGHKYRMTI
jgi:hypothetical protein